MTAVLKTIGWTVLLMALGATMVNAYTCHKWHNRYDTTLYAQACTAYYVPKAIEGWEFNKTWFTTECIKCRNWNGTEEEINSIDEGDLARNQPGDGDPVQCCLYGKPPYYAGPEWDAVALNPSSGESCASQHYGMTLFGQWLVYDFYAPLSNCFWIVWEVTDNGMAVPIPDYRFPKGRPN